MTRSYPPEAWGLTTAPSGALALEGHDLVGLAQAFGTPLHVVSANHLRGSARGFLTGARAAYPGDVSVHYAMKCNSVPGVVEQIRRRGWARKSAPSTSCTWHCASASRRATSWSTDPARPRRSLPRASPPASS